MRTLMLGLSVSMLSACGADNLSLGEAGCVGERVVCQAKAALMVEAQLVEPEFTPEQSATVQWQTLALPSGCDSCEPGVGTDPFVVHPDGSVTVAKARAVHENDEAEHERVFLELAHVNAEGSVVWRKRVHERTAEDRPIYNYEPAMGVDDEGTAYLAFNESPGDAQTITFFRVQPDGTLKKLFEQPSPIWTGSLDSLAIVQGDLFTYQDNGSDRSLSRYGSDGELKWRQTALAERGDGSEPLPPGRAIPVTTIQTMAVDTRQRVYTLPDSPDGTYFHAVRADGNIDWSILLSDSIGAVTRRVILDSQDRPVVTMHGDGHLVLRFEPAAEGAARFAPTGFLRLQDQYYMPHVFGVDVDSDDRIHVASQTGNRGERKLFIERVSADFSEVQTYIVEDAALNAESTLVLGMGLGPEGDVRLIVNDERGTTVARVRLGATEN